MDRSSIGYGAISIAVCRWSTTTQAMITTSALSASVLLVALLLAHTHVIWLLWLHWIVPQNVHVPGSLGTPASGATNSPGPHSGATSSSSWATTTTTTSTPAFATSTSSASTTSSSAASSSSASSSSVPFGWCQVRRELRLDFCVQEVVALRLLQDTAIQPTF